MGEVPIVAGCMGSVAGLGAARVAASHFAVMVRGSSQLFVAGPPVVKFGVGEDLTKEDLGGSHIHAYVSGAVDNEAESEDDAFAQIRRFLSYLPQNVWQVPPRAEPEDDPNRREEELLDLIPRNRRAGYDARRMLELILDRDSFFEITPYFGGSLITGFARLDGYPVGVMANDPFVSRRLARRVGFRQTVQVRRYSATPFICRSSISATSPAFSSAAKPRSPAPSATACARCSRFFNPPRPGSRSWCGARSASPARVTARPPV